MTNRNENIHQATPEEPAQGGRVLDNEGHAFLTGQVFGRSEATPPNDLAAQGDDDIEAPVQTETLDLMHAGLRDEGRAPAATRQVDSSLHEVGHGHGSPSDDGSSTLASLGPTGDGQVAPLDDLEASDIEAALEDLDTPDL